MFALFAVKMFHRSLLHARNAEPITIQDGEMMHMMDSNCQMRTSTMMNLYRMNLGLLHVRMESSQFGGSPE